jgi:hypothetical protein
MIYLAAKLLATALQPCRQQWCRAPVEQGITDIEVHVHALCRSGILLLHNRGLLGVSWLEPYRASMGRGLSLSIPSMLIWTMKWTRLWSDPPTSPWTPPCPPATPVPSTRFIDFIHSYDTTEACHTFTHKRASKQFITIMFISTIQLSDTFFDRFRSNVAVLCTTMDAPESILGPPPHDPTCHSGCDGWSYKQHPRK